MALLLSLSLFGEDFDDFEEFEDEMVVKKVYDPFEGYNRWMTDFNDGLYMNVMRPINTGYTKVTTIGMRRSVDRFFKNLYYPMRFINNVLQGKFHNAFEETGRFVVNSTAGVLGLFDPAKTEMGIQAHDEDFGQTLGFYGVGAGPHIVLPLWGPSNLRDIAGIFPDAAVSPIDYKERSWPTLTDTWGEFLAVKSYEQVNKYSLFQSQYMQIREDAIDLYPYLKDIYEQKRDAQIKE